MTVAPLGDDDQDRPLGVSSRRRDGKRLPRQRRETHDGEHDQAEGAELVFLSFAVALAQLAALSVEDGPGERVPALGPVELGADPPTVGLVVEVGEQVEGLGDPAGPGDGPAERGGSAAARQDGPELLSVSPAANRDDLQTGRWPIA